MNTRIQELPEVIYYTPPLPESNYKTISTTKYIGGYRMGSGTDANGYITFSLPNKPFWLHRIGVRLVLGWKWVDADEHFGVEK